MRIDTRKRIMSQAVCRYCASTNELYFDEKHDEYLCVSCLLEEREKIAMQNEDDEDAMNERHNLKNQF
jgi:hypothetical protein